MTKIICYGSVEELDDFLKKINYETVKIMAIVYDGLNKAMPKHEQLKEIEGDGILPPSEIINFDYDYVVILTIYRRRYFNYENIICRTTV